MDEVTAEATRVAAEVVVAGAASKVTAGGAVAAVLGAVVSSQGIAIMGLVVTVLGFLVNAHYQRKRDRREAEELRALLAGEIRVYLDENGVACRIEERVTERTNK